ncbi:MAG: thiamine phosphate synthase, partial [Planctomycetes bacterium]|nr:thiamine phosphate synthase [Planctomycetota bacterium]
RVLEDYARFNLNDGAISLLAKTLRHDLCAAIGQLPTLDLLTARDTPDDVGTQLSTEQELTRPDPLAVASAAAKRLPEALRCLEEYTKIDNLNIAKELEAIRYRTYTLEKQLLTTANRSNRFQNVRIYVLLTSNLCKHNILETTQQVLEGGADCIQLREKDLPDSELIPLATKICQLCHDAGALFIINDRPDIAVLSNADGVHLGQDDMPVQQARKILSSNKLVGKSTHNLDEVKHAINESPDYLAAGSIFPSPTKPSVTQSGLQLIENTRDIYKGPLIAIGGITIENAHNVIQAGATGIAVCSAVIGSDNPITAISILKSGLSDPNRAAHT